MHSSRGATFLLFLLLLNWHSTSANVHVAAAVKWLEHLQIPEIGWGTSTAKVVMAMSLTDSLAAPRCSMDPRLLLSYSLLKEAWREGLENIPHVRLAEYILALSSVCRNPLNFHGKNLIALLGDRTDRMDFQYAYTALALCSSNTRKYSHMYKHLFRLDRKQMIHLGTDTLSMSALALKCIARQHKSGLEKFLAEIAENLRSRQLPSGRFENFHATILAVQALRAIGAENWDEKAAMRYLLSHLREDGSFGSLFDTTQILPLLANKTMADISMRSCHGNQQSRGWRRDQKEFRNRSQPIDPNESRDQNEYGDQEESRDRPVEADIPWITFTLWQWVGLNVSAIYREELTVPANTSLFNSLQLAAERNPNFEFSVTVWPNGHYVYRIGNNGEQKVGYHFWLLYRLSAAPDPLSKPDKSFINPTGADQLFPENGDHILFWFKNI